MGRAGVAWVIISCNGVTGAEGNDERARDLAPHGKPPQWGCAQHSTGGPAGGSRVLSHTYVTPVMYYSQVIRGSCSHDRMPLWRMF